MVVPMPAAAASQAQQLEETAAVFKLCASMAFYSASLLKPAVAIRPTPRLSPARLATVKSPSVPKPTPVKSPQTPGRMEELLTPVPAAQ